MMASARRYIYSLYWIHRMVDLPLDQRHPHGFKHFHPWKGKFLFTLDINICPITLLVIVELMNMVMHLHARLLVKSMCVCILFFDINNYQNFMKNNKPHHVFEGVVLSLRALIWQSKTCACLLTNAWLRLSLMLALLGAQCRCSSSFLIHVFWKISSIA